MSGNELAFIEWLGRINAASASVPAGIGDDCAVLRIGDQEVLITTDMLLDGTHFDSQRHTPEQIGYKSMACSLSDIAAMAGRPIGAVVAVGLTRGCGIEFAKRMSRGMKEVADRFACPIIGGDTTSWMEPTSVCVTILGRCPSGRRPILRSGAKIGDGLYVTGTLGGSLLVKHMCFEPRIELADQLAGRCSIHAMMDISDGLAIDLSRICQASGVGAVLDESLIEGVISDDARRLSREDGISPIDHALNDGEDFELLMVMPEQPVPQGLSDMVRPVGQIVASGLQWRRSDGVLVPFEPRGYEHPL